MLGKDEVSTEHTVNAQILVQLKSDKYDTALHYKTNDVTYINSLVAYEFLSCQS